MADSEQGDVAEEIKPKDLSLEWREAGFILARPIHQDDGDEVTSVEFLEPTVAMLKVMDRHKGEVAQAVALVSRMTNLTPTDVHRMHPRDFVRCQDVAQSFFGEFLGEDGPQD